MPFIAAYLTGFIVFALVLWAENRVSPADQQAGLPALLLVSLAWPAFVVGYVWRSL